MNKLHFTPNNCMKNFCSMTVILPEERASTKDIIKNTYIFVYHSKFYFLSATCLYFDSEYYRCFHVWYGVFLCAI